MAQGSKLDKKRQKREKKNFIYEKANRRICSNKNPKKKYFGKEKKTEGYFRQENQIKIILEKTCSYK